MTFSGVFLVKSSSSGIPAECSVKARNWHYISYLMYIMPMYYRFEVKMADEILYIDPVSSGTVVRVKPFNTTGYISGLTYQGSDLLQTSGKVNFPTIFFLGDEVEWDWHGVPGDVNALTIDPYIWYNGLRYTTGSGFWYAPPVKYNGINIGYHSHSDNGVNYIDSIDLPQVTYSDSAVFNIQQTGSSTWVFRFPSLNGGWWSDYSNPPNHPYSQIEMPVDFVPVGQRQGWPYIQMRGCVLSPLEHHPTRTCYEKRTDNLTNNRYNYAYLTNEIEGRKQIFASVHTNLDYDGSILIGNYQSMNFNVYLDFKVGDYVSSVTGQTTQVFYMTNLRYESVSRLKKRNWLKTLYHMFTKSWQEHRYETQVQEKIEKL